MSFNQCLDVIKTLSLSQGFYGRILRQISEMDVDNLELLKEDWDGRFSDALDLIYYFEC